MKTSMTKRTLVLAAAMTVLAAMEPAAQSGQPAGAQEAAGRQTAGEAPQLKVQITLSRSKPGAETTTLPFELMILADGRQNTTVNVGVDVPTPGSEGSIRYRRVGNNISVSRASYTNGAVRLDISVEDSSIHTDTATQAQRSTAVVPTTGGNVMVPILAGPQATTWPTFRSFQTVASLSMREGETVQFTLATDKQTGETLRVSVSASRVR
jgi:hypothetical protein